MLLSAQEANFGGAGGAVMSIRHIEIAQLGKGILNSRNISGIIHQPEAVADAVITHKVINGSMIVHHFVDDGIDAGLVAIGEKHW